MPESFGKYRLVRKIAQGGMAEIFLATREGELGGFEKKVAIKRIFQHLTGREETVKMFFDEARIAAALNHPNIVQVYDLGEVDDYFYIAMEFVHGTDLRRICKRGLDRDHYLPLEFAARIIADTAAGLHYAHTRTDQEGNPRNIVHRDISPQNVLVGMEGHVKICDFGIAKAENRLARTRTGQHKGKLSYMSPEQFNGDQLDARSDIFNLGIVLYEVALGRRLFNAQTDFERMRQIADAQVTPPSDIQPEFPPGLERIVMRALNHDPADRYQTAEQMQVELEEWLHDRRQTVGPVQVSNYMESVFPELVGGLPQDVGQVEFPKEGRDGTETVQENSSGSSERRETAGPEVPGVTPEDPTQPVPRDAIPDAALEEGKADVFEYGGVTVDPSQQRGKPDNIDRAADSAEVETSDEKEENTRPMQVDREELREAMAEGEDAESAVSDSEPAPTDELDGTPTAERESEEFGVRQREVETAERSPGASSREPTNEKLGDGRDSGEARRGAGEPPTRDELPGVGAGADPETDHAEPATTQDERPSVAYPDATPSANGDGASVEADDSPDRSSGHDDRGGDVDTTPESGIRERVEESFDALEIPEASFGSRRRKLLALGGLGLAVVALGVFGYMIVAHQPEISGPDAPRAELGPDASLPTGPQVDLVEAKLASEPAGARIIVNGRDTRETTPASVELVAGKTNDVYLYLDDHASQHVQIEGRESEEARKFDLEEIREDVPRGSLSVESEPSGATAYLDGEQVGETPLTIESMSAEHTHHVRLVHGGFHPAVGLMDIEADGETPTSIDLAAVKGDEDHFCEVVYDLVPGGAMVGVNGELQGTTDVAVRHRCGEYLEVSAWKSNYEDREHFLHLREPAQYFLRTRLDKIVRARGTIHLDVPDSLRVFVGSNGYGRGSVEDLELPEGEYTAVFETDDRERFERILTVRPSTTTHYRVRRDDGEILLERVER
jgi:serine/threonine protein kinase